MHKFKWIKIYIFKYCKVSMSWLISALAIGGRIPAVLQMMQSFISVLEISAEAGLIHHSWARHPQSILDNPKQIFEICWIDTFLVWTIHKTGTHVSFYLKVLLFLIPLMKKIKLLCQSGCSSIRGNVHHGLIYNCRGVIRSSHAWSSHIMTSHDIVMSLLDSPSRRSGRTQKW